MTVDEALTSTWFPTGIDNTTLHSFPAATSHETLNSTWFPAETADETLNSTWFPAMTVRR